LQVKLIRRIERKIEPAGTGMREYDNTIVGLKKIIMI
jgi:hypothetical protein